MDFYHQSMIAYLKQFVNTPNKPRIWLLLANILLVFFLILLSNLKVLPIENIGDFLFLAFLFLALALYRPGWAFLFFTGTIALENINLAPAEIGFNIRPYQFFAALTIIAVLVRLAAKRLNFKLPEWKWIDWAPAVFAIAGFASALFAVDKSIALRQSVIAASFVIIYFLARIFIQNSEDLKKIIPFFLSSSIIVILYGIWQNIRYSHNLSNFEAMPGRPNASFAEADWLGIYLGLLIAVIYTVIYYFSNKKSEKVSPQISNFKSNQIYKYQILKTLLFLLLTATYALLILTVSRSAWLGALIVTFAYLFIIWTNLKISPKHWQWKFAIRRKLEVISAFIVAVAIVYLFHLTNFQLFNRAQSTGTGLQKITIACDTILELSSRIGSINELNQYGCRHINLEEIDAEKAKGNFVTEIYRQDPNVNIRGQIYQKSWQEIKRHPVLGIGWGNIGNILGKDERGTNLNSSNIFLEVWLGTGILGLLAFSAILFYTLIKSVILVRSGGNETKALGLFLLLGSLSIIIPNLFNAGIFLGFLWIFLGVPKFEQNKP